MASDGLKRDEIVILRIDGEDLLEFLDGPNFETEMLSVFSEIELSSNESYSDQIIKALEKLTVDQGMPPAYDSWVRSNIIDVALESCVCYLQKPISKETYFIHFKKVIEMIAKLLKEQPVIVAHSQKTYDGSGIKRLLSNKFELDKNLNYALQKVPRDMNGKISNEYLREAFDFIAPLAGLPFIGAVHQMDKVTNEAFNKILNTNEAKIMEEEEFKNVLIKLLESIMLQLQANLIIVNTSSVLHEPLASSSEMVLNDEQEI